MAQEAVRRDELVDSFSIGKSVTQTDASSDTPVSWVVQVPLASRPISRIVCDLSVNISEDEVLNFLSLKYTGAPALVLYCRELASVVGHVTSSGLSSLWRVTEADGKTVNLNGNMQCSACQPQQITTWLRPERDIRQMTLDLMIPSGSSFAPFTLYAPAAGGGIQLFVHARFTFFGPRDTRMYM